MAKEPTLESEAAPGGAPIRVGVYGASGTSGVELVGILVDHPRTTVEFCTSRGSAGADLTEVDPGAPSFELSAPEAVDPADCDVVFLCLPHGSAAEVAEHCLAAGCRVIDLSGDLRLEDEQAHADVYGTPRSAEVAERAIYGLTEFCRDDLREADLVANPGCYPTSVALALAPLAEAGRLDGLPVVDAKSGVSGAGRAPSATNHFCSVTGDVRPYKVGRGHRHVAEIEQLIRKLAPSDRATPIAFSPHLVPVERGLISTIVVEPGGLSADEVRQLLERRYGAEPFVQVLPAGQQARLRGVTRTNRAAISVDAVEGTDAVVLISAIDNLVKGAAGQAVQNMNVMFGLDETTGLSGAQEAAEGGAA